MCGEDRKGEILISDFTRGNSGDWRREGKEDMGWEKGREGRYGKGDGKGRKIWDRRREG